MMSGSDDALLSGSHCASSASSLACGSASGSAGWPATWTMTCIVIPNVFQRGVDIG